MLSTYLPAAHTQQMICASPLSTFICEASSDRKTLYVSGMLIRCPSLPPGRNYMVVARLTRDYSGETTELRESFWFVPSVRNRGSFSRSAHAQTGQLGGLFNHCIPHYTAVRFKREPDSREQYWLVSDPLFDQSTTTAVSWFPHGLPFLFP